MYIYQRNQPWYYWCLQKKPALTLHRKHMLNKQDIENKKCAINVHQKYIEHVGSQNKT